jgi:S-DNA-T family DNA segregation ATPase FtsK/SpoIIIE
VVLQPQAVSEQRAHKAPAIDPQRAQLLREIGCLFVDNGRVAVSMLQRKYSMEFDDACKVLDELQDLGLIGPYLGGQRRDILLSREQWLEKVGAG